MNGHDARSKKWKYSIFIINNFLEWQSNLQPVTFTITGLASISSLFYFNTPKWRIKPNEYLTIIHHWQSSNNARLNAKSEERKPGINLGEQHYSYICLSIGRLIGGSSTRCEPGTGDLRASRATWRDARASNPARHFIWEELLVTRKRNAYARVSEILL